MTWHKSSHSSANECVEVGMWKKSTRSGPWTDNCVEVTGTEEREVLVRDTKDNGEGPVLRFTEAEWKAFLAGVRDGEFDLADTP